MSQSMRGRRHPADLRHHARPINSTRPHMGDDTADRTAKPAPGASAPPPPPPQLGANPAAAASAIDAAPEKRQYLALRGLVDEMLATIRGTVNRDLWTAAERARAEADLSRIMAQVQSETLRLHRGGSDSAA